MDNLIEALAAWDSVEGETLELCTEDCRGFTLTLSDDGEEG